MGLGRGHCNRSSIGSRVHNILEAIKPDAAFDKYPGLVIFEGSLTGNSEDHLERKRIQGVAAFDAMKSNAWNEEVLCLLFGL